MTRLWFVRHGPTHAKFMVGWSDIPADLSDRAAIERLARYLPNAPVVSSDLIRAVATADAIQENRPRLEHDPALREINFGDWEMRTFDQDDARLRAYWETPGDIAPPNGESWNATSNRVSAAVDSYLARGFSDLILVGHFGMILTQVQRALGISAYETFAHRISNLSVTQITVGPDRWTLETIDHNP